MIKKRGTSNFLIPAICCLCLFSLCGCHFPFGRSTSSDHAQQRSPKLPCVVLALPATGPHAQLAARIRQGAELAQKEMLANGINVRLENINTEASDWIERLEQLPPWCSTVGGPIQQDKYAQARKAGLLERRTFFTFLARLGAGEEGKLAWRFFPGPKDQVNALLNFTVNDLNIRSYGVFYPDDEYGRQMVRMLANALDERHMSLERASYHGADPASWAAAAKPLIRPAYPEGGKNPVPQTLFEAIFLPDSWKNTDLLMNSLLYNGEDRLVVMGPSLWEQALNGRKLASAEKYSLAVFPSPWDPSKKTKSGNQHASFWEALGFDFLNFAASLEIDSRPASSEVASRARRHEDKIRAIAPIIWGQDGVATQRLYLFQPSAQGMKKLNTQQFQEARRQRYEEAALRFQDGFSEVPVPEGDIDGESGLPKAAPASSPQDASGLSAPIPARATGQPAAPALGVVPHPSYKLRLPARQ